ncbi:acetolactate synthase, regulatory subunit [Blastocladiella emersonii ATCC 22665]|nr:acetolactate synthase, regulatory subunit [Blastocladiella emersonii ATCC 22665]
MFRITSAASSASRHLALTRRAFTTDAAAAAAAAASAPRFARRKHHPALLKAPTPTVEEAVTNILYNTPTAGPASARAQRHVLNCLVTDEPGVLSRVSGILAARGFNIDSLVVSKTDVKDLSRMTIALKGTAGTIEQAKKQLEDLVPVWAVLDYTHTRLIEREMALAKVSIVPAGMLDQIYAAEHALGEEGEDAIDRSHKHDAGNPDALLEATHKQLASVTRLARLFGAKVVDVSAETAVVELCAKSSRIEAFLKLLHPFGLVEVARSGMMAMTRTPVDGVYESEVEEAEEVEVDAAALPPS